MVEFAVARVVWVGRGRPDDDIPTYLLVDDDEFCFIDLFVLDFCRN